MVCLDVQGYTVLCKTKWCNSYQTYWDITSGLILGLV